MDKDKRGMIIVGLIVLLVLLFVSYVLLRAVTGG